VLRGKSTLTRLRQRFRASRELRRGESARRASVPARRCYRTESRCASASSASKISATRSGVISSPGFAARDPSTKGSFTRCRIVVRATGSCANPRRRNSAMRSVSVRFSSTARSFTDFINSSGRSRVVFMQPEYQKAGFLGNGVRTRNQARLARVSRIRPGGWTESLSRDGATRGATPRLCVRSRHRRATPRNHGTALSQQ
jgi:hypothetical protein